MALILQIAKIRVLLLLINALLSKANQMNAHYPQTNLTLGFILLVIVMDTIGVGIIMPVLPKLIGTMIEGTVSEAALYGGGLLFTYALMQFLFAPVMGGLSDQYGRRPVLLLSLLGFAVSYLLLAVAPCVTWLFIGRILAGIVGASITTAVAYIADISTPKNKAQNIGLVNAAAGLGLVIGPAIGGVLGEYGARTPFIVASLILFTTLLYGYFVLPESLSQSQRRPFQLSRANAIGTLLQMKKYPLLFNLMWSYFALHVAAHAIDSIWAFFTIEKFGWSTQTVGWSMAFMGCMVVIVHSMIVRVFIPRMGEQHSVSVGLLLCLISFVLFFLATEGWMMYGLLVLYVIGGMAFPALLGMMSNQVSDQEQGELLGAATSIVALAGIVGSSIMTTTFSYFADLEKSAVYFPSAPMLLGAVFTLLSMRFFAKAMK